MTPSLQQVVESRDLHAEIMRLPEKRESIHPGLTADVAYKLGHRDARHAAAELVLTAHEEPQAVIAGLREDAERYRLIRAGYCVLELLTPEARPEEGLNYRQSTIKAELNYGNPEEGEALDRFIDRTALQANKEQP